MWQEIANRKHFDGIGLALLLLCGHSTAAAKRKGKKEAWCGWCEILEKRRAGTWA